MIPHSRESFTAVVDFLLGEGCMPQAQVSMSILKEVMRRRTLSRVLQTLVGPVGVMAQPPSDVCEEEPTSTSTLNLSVASKGPAMFPTDLDIFFCSTVQWACASSRCYSGSSRA